MISLGKKKITELLGSSINSSFWKENEAILWTKITDYLFQISGIATNHARVHQGIDSRKDVCISSKILAFVCVLISHVEHDCCLAYQRTLIFHPCKNQNLKIISRITETKELYSSRYNSSNNIVRQCYPIKYIRKTRQGWVCKFSQIHTLHV